MGILQNIIARLRQKKEEEEKLPDDETRDKYLRSLRRERRTQLEEMEKEYLKKKIAEYKKKRMKKYLYGIKESAAKKSIIKKMHKRKPKNILSNGGTFYGKSRL